MDNDAICQKLNDVLGEGVRESVPMREHTTLRVGGVSDFFYETDEIEMLVRAINCCFENKIPYIVIGSGSGIVFSDAGFPGLVIYNRSSRISFLAEKNQVIVDAGCSFSRLVTESASRSLSGVEWWYGIPGTIGGALYNNSTVFGHQISEVIKTVTLLIPPKNDTPAAIKQVDRDWMECHDYSTRLKSWQGNKPVILTALLQLRQQRRDEIMERMRVSQKKFFPFNQTEKHFSAGSFFSIDPNSELDLRSLLVASNIKKLKIGDAAVAKDAPEFIINLGQASATEIFQLKTLAIETVKDKLGVQLKDKVEYLGIWSSEQT